MHIKDAYDQMVQEKQQLVNEIDELILTCAEKGVFTQKEAIKVRLHFAELTNNIIKPFSE